MSYVGWLEYANCFNLLNKYVLEDAELLKIIDLACVDLDIENPLLKKYGEQS